VLASVLPAKLDSTPTPTKRSASPAPPASFLVSQPASVPPVRSESSQRASTTPVAASATTRMCSRVQRPSLLAPTLPLVASAKPGSTRVIPPTLARWYSRGSQHQHLVRLSICLRWRKAFGGRLQPQPRSFLA
jgi:hypothetical protein